MVPEHHVVTGATRAEVHTCFTDRAAGDLRIDGDPSALAARRGALAPQPWTWLRQEHGARVLIVERPGEHAGEIADAAVTAVPGATLAVHTADCAGVLLHGTADGVDVVGAAHAGWRGLAAGVLAATVDSMRSLGAEQITWRLGPCISAAEYEFGPDDLATVVAAVGADAATTTRTGSPALDLRRGVAAALAAAGARPAEPPGTDVACTASSDRWYSWRARRDAGRQAALTWMTAP